MRVSIFALVACGCLASLSTISTSARQVAPGIQETPALDVVLHTYCITCHNQKLHTANIAFDGVDPATPAANPEPVSYTHLTLPTKA